MLRKLFRNRKGQGLVEYALIVGGVAITCALAITIFGLKTSEMIAGYAGLLPGANTDTNANITQAALFEVENDGGTIRLDMAEIVNETNTDRLNTTFDAFGDASLEDYVVNADRVN